jgi:hypothetical protein
MAAERARIERRVWDSLSRHFVATDESLEGAVSGIEQLANELSGPVGHFLKGPVPWPWIIAAANLSRTALIVGLCLWRLAGALKRRTVTFGNTDLKPFGVDRAAKSRALAALEGAGLIKVSRMPSRFPSVTLLASVGPLVRGTRGKGKRRSGARNECGPHCQ